MHLKLPDSYGEIRKIKYIVLMTPIKKREEKDCPPPYCIAHHDLPLPAIVVEPRCPHLHETFVRIAIGDMQA